jgi:hypothetical protein
MNMSTLRGFVLSFLVCGFLLGCSAVPIATMVKLNRVDIATTDVKALHVALRVPRFLRIKRDGVFLEFVVQGARNALVAKDRFVLAALPMPSDAKALGLNATAEQVLTVYKIADADMARMKALQTMVITEKTKGRKDYSGSISIGADGCTASTRDAPVIFSTFIKPAELDEFVPLLLDIDLADLLRGQSDIPAIASCPAL